MIMMIMMNTTRGLGRMASMYRLASMITVFMMTVTIMMMKMMMMMMMMITRGWVGWMGRLACQIGH